MRPFVGSTLSSVFVITVGGVFTGSFFEVPEEAKTDEIANIDMTDKESIFFISIYYKINYDYNIQTIGDCQILFS